MWAAMCDSSSIPSFIRRPWQVFEEDLEEKLEEAGNDGQPEDTELQAQFSVVQKIGAKVAYRQLDAASQIDFLHVFLMEAVVFGGFQACNGLSVEC